MPAAVSTIFKEAKGGTFLEFLSKTRMEKAKELQEQTALKNYEIAEKVGFSDPHYFGISLLWNRSSFSEERASQQLPAWRRII